MYQDSQKGTYITLLIVLALLIGAGIYYHRQETASINPSNPDVKNYIPPITKRVRSLHLLTINLAPLSEGHYEGWIIDNQGTSISAGTFIVDKNNEPKTLNGDPYQPTGLDSIDIQTLSEFRITVEPQNDTDPNPSNAVILQGPFERGMAKLSFRAVNLDSISGSIILGTPTDGPGNETSGIWFVSPDGILPSLSLPNISGGWVYEGWIKYGKTLLSTGIFTSPLKPDLFNDYSDTRVAPPLFPGEDFILNSPSKDLEFPIDLATTEVPVEVIVSIQPRFDKTATRNTAISPFQILGRTIPADTKDHVPIELDTLLFEFPTAIVSVE